MVGKLLDTNAIIALQRGEVGIIDLLEASPDVVLSSVVVGELYIGAVNSQQVEANIEAIEELVALLPTLVVDTVTSYYYAQVRRHLKLKGRPIPENDLWIAAHALQHNLILVTDDGHFGYIDGLQLETWRLL